MCVYLYEFTIQNININICSEILQWFLAKFEIYSCPFVLCYVDRSRWSLSAWFSRIGLVMLQYQTTSKSQWLKVARMYSFYASCPLIYPLYSLLKDWSWRKCLFLWWGKGNGANCALKISPRGDTYPSADI